LTSDEEVTIAIAPDAWASSIAKLWSWRREEMGESIGRHGQEENWEKGRKTKIRHRKGKNGIDECTYVATPLVL
jgi:hypothetical protein